MLSLYTSSQMQTLRTYVARPFMASSEPLDPDQVEEGSLPSAASPEPQSPRRRLGVVLMLL